MWYKRDRYVSVFFFLFFSTYCSLWSSFSLCHSFLLHTTSTKSNWKYHMMMSCNISKRILSFVAVAVAVAVTATSLVLMPSIFMLYIACSFFIWFNYYFIHIFHRFCHLTRLTRKKTLNGLFSFSISTKRQNHVCMSMFFFSSSFLHLNSQESKRECVCYK